MCLIKLKGNSFLSMTKNFTHNRNQPCVKEQARHVCTSKTYERMDSAVIPYISEQPAIKRVKLVAFHIRVDVLIYISRHDPCGEEYWNEVEDQSE